MKSSFIALLLLALLLIQPATVLSCEWVRGTGEVFADNFTPAEARTMALRQARYQAIEKATGVYVSGATLVKDFTYVGEFVKSISKGYIREEKIISWEQDKYQPSERDFPVPILRVTLEVCVQPARPLHDTGFMITAAINKQTFTKDEKAVLEITSSRKAFLHIFNLTADDKILYYHKPPALQMPIPVEAGVKITFPRKGISLEMAPPAGYKKATEAFIIVATANDINLPLVFRDKRELSLAEFYDGIMAIEGDMAESMVVYSIEGR
jgi:hypothetical protein